MKSHPTPALPPSIACASMASAVDHSAASIEVTQGWQDTAETTALVDGNAAAVRVKVDLNG